MAQYIDKSALVSEIESKIKKYTKRGEESDAKRDGYGMYWGGVLSCLNEVLTLCDTIEVKEVDLELNSFDATVCKIGNTYLKEMDKDAIVKVLEPYKNGDKVKVIIKAQKGE